MERVDYQRYSILPFCNILIISMLVVGLQTGFTVKPGSMVNYWYPIHYKIKGLYTCKPPFKFTEQLRTAAKKVFGRIFYSPYHLPQDLSHDDPSGTKRFPSPSLEKFLFLWKCRIGIDECNQPLRNGVFNLAGSTSTSIYNSP